MLKWKNCRKYERATAINADNNQIIKFLNWKQWKEFYVSVLKMFW